MIIEKAKSLGLDFGTSNSAVATVFDGDIKIIPVGSEQKQSIKSVLFFPAGSQEVYVGDEAITRYVEAGMKGRLLRSFKSALKDPSFTSTLINGKRITIETLVSFVLKELHGAATHYLGQSTDRVVLGRPAEFSENVANDNLAQQRLESAARSSGFTNIEFQLEPIAAAFDYKQQLKSPEVVLVADLGGGTSDFTIMHLQPVGSATSDTILGSSGVYLGGDNFDADIMRSKIIKHFGAEARYDSSGKWLHVPHRMMEALCDWRRLSFFRDDRREQELLQIISRSTDDPDAIARLLSLINNDLGFALSQAVEQAKIALSVSDETELVFDQGGIVIRERLTREEFEHDASFNAQKILQCAVDLVDQVRVDDIDVVFMTGGTSQIPLIGNLFGHHFGEDKIRRRDAFTSVASGLAWSASQ
jgi:hypothetical chaperone protein